jgi:hypothetical protein
VYAVDPPNISFRGYIICYCRSTYDLWCFCQDFKRAGISRLLEKKGQGAVLAKKKCNLHCTRKYFQKEKKTDRISLLSRSLKKFSICFNTFKTLMELVSS